jgi:hypothetical protein
VGRRTGPFGVSTLKRRGLLREQADLTGTGDRPDADVRQSLARLESYVVDERFRGWDPYDALTSPLFGLPVLRSSKWIRIAATQALKRSRYNLRPLLGIRKGYNPVTVALILEASAYRAATQSDDEVGHRQRAEYCVAELARLQTPGFSGACWGYDFDWEARYGRLPAGTPTIVATGLVTNALFAAYRLLGLDEALQLCERATSFVINDLPRHPGDGDSFCWGYYPGDRQRVLNATMKGARLCAQVYSITNDEELRRAAAATTSYVRQRQHEDGSWPYAVGDTRSWADNFHTAYVLDAFDTYRRATKDDDVEPTIQKGWKFYRTSFFTSECVPKYYPDSSFPVDATACAQSLLTLCRFDDVETANRLAHWTIANLQCADGHFAYQLRRRGLVKIPYMRWSSAYIYLGLSRLEHALQGGEVPA